MNVKGRDAVLERNRIHPGDCRVLLEKMDPESVHVAVTSPPYYGLRDYGAEPVIWDADPDCEHVWGPQAPGQRANRNHVGGSLGADRVGGGRRKNDEGKHGQFCACCNGWRGCLGREPTPDLYVQHLVQIMRQIWRVLRSDGTLWINIADAHAGGGRGGNTTNRPGVKQDTNKGSLLGPAGVPPGAKAKDLLLIPDMLAMALRADGWVFRQKNIWDKPNPMPESVESRPTTAHEFIFMLAKSNKAQYWTHRSMDGVRSKPKPDYRWIDRANGDEEVLIEPAWNWREETYGIDADPGLRRRWSRINLWRGHDYFYDHVAIQEPAKYSGDPRGGRPCSRRGSEMKQISERTVTGPMRNKRSVWRVVTEPFKGAHFAAYPKRLIEPCILAGSSPMACPECGAPWHRSIHRNSYITRPTTGSADQKHKLEPGNAKGLERVGGHVAVDTKTIGWLPTCGCEGNDGSARCLVLDPFGGSGTTGVVAAIQGRDYMLFEANDEYVEMATERIRKEGSQPVMTEIFVPGYGMYSVHYWEE